MTHGRVLPKDPDIQRPPVDRLGRQASLTSVVGEAVHKSVARGVVGLACVADDRGDGGVHDEVVQVQVFGQLVQVPHASNLGPGSRHVRKDLFKGGQGSWESTQLLLVLSYKILSLLKESLQPVSMVTSKGLCGLSLSI